MKVPQISRRVLVPAMIVLLVAAVTMTARAVVSPGKKHAVAYFASVTGVYRHDKVRILGLPVGRIEKITPEKDRVRVDFTYDGHYKLPGDVKAAIVSPTLVATRFLQLAPAYTRGSALPDGGVIPQSRTAAPLEFDDLKSEISRISHDLGPQREGDRGALADFLSVSAKAGAGRGAQFNQMVTEASSALKTLSEGRGDIFATVRNLQVFISAMAALDQDMVAFNQHLAGVSGMLDDNGESLNRAIASVDTAARLVDRFLAENRPAVGRALPKLSRLTTMLAQSRDDLATDLHIGPNMLTNFTNIYSPRINAYTGALAIGNTSMGGVLCALVANQFAELGKADTGCEKYLGPLLDQVQIKGVPVGVGTALEQPQPAQQPSDPGENDESHPAQSLLGLLFPGGGQ